MKRVALFFPYGRNNLAELGQAGNTKVLLVSLCDHVQSTGFSKQAISRISIYETAKKINAFFETTKFTPLEVKKIMLAIHSKKDGKYYIGSTNISNGVHEETRRKKKSKKHVIKA
ncbi:MAG: hypothetical protein V3R78_13665 [Thermodesulfobacteriota bacterium]